jgi:hypothetical protein
MTARKIARLKPIFFNGFAAFYAALIRKMLTPLTTSSHPANILTMGSKKR